MTVYAIVPKIAPENYEPSFIFNYLAAARDKYIEVCHVLSEFQDTHEIRAYHITLTYSRTIAIKL
jgi:hypothetical protein